MGEEKKKLIREVFLEMGQALAFGLATNSMFINLKSGNKKEAVSNGIVSTLYLTKMIIPKTQNVVSVIIAVFLTGNLVVSLSERKKHIES